MDDQIDPEFVELLKILNQAVISIDNTEKLIENVQKNLVGFKNIRDKVLIILKENYPESSRN